MFIRHAPALAVAVLSFTVAARSQCTASWVPGVGSLPGTAGSISTAHVWDQDGAGPLAAVLAVGGSFSTIGDLAANSIAMQDLGTGAWSTPGSGTNGQVRAFATLPNGDLVVAGSFTTAGGTPTSRIARWDGTSWSPLGAGMFATPTTTNEVLALAVLPNGDLVAAGSFAGAGGVDALNVARWDGTAWWPLGSGANGVVFSLAVLPNGDLVAGGDFSQAGGVAALRIARWDGATWSAIGSGVAATVHAIATLANGDVVAGGELSGSTAPLHRWNGAAWSVIGTFDHRIHGLTVLPNGELVVGGSFAQELSGPTGSRSVARWNGTSWSGLGSGLSIPVSSPAAYCLVVLPGGDLLVGGSFRKAGGVSAWGIATWNGTTWSTSGPGGFDGNVIAALQTPNGDIVIGGAFTTAGGGVAARGVARWNGTTWTGLGVGMSQTGGVQDPVRALTSLPNGDVIAGGAFSSAGGVAAANVARWDGTAWSPLGSGVNGVVHALVTMPNGDVVAGGEFTTAGGSPVNRVARWNGTTWAPLGIGMDLGGVYCLALTPQGDVIAGGFFFHAGGTLASSIARWNGSSWSPLGSGINGFGTVYALVATPSGDVFAGGTFGGAGGGSASNIARWNGSSWSNLGSGVGAGVRAMMLLPDGDLLVGGTFSNAGPVAANRLARWNGTSWMPAGSMNGDVSALVGDASALPFAGGAFTSPAPGVASAFVARMTTNCMATSAPFGVGCPGSGGNTLTAATLPWVDGVFHGTGTGLPLHAIVVAATSVTPIAQGAFPLASVFGQALPGCDLLVAPDILEPMLTTTGSATSSLFLPDTPPLVGVTFYHQMVPIELDAQGDWVSITATNALQLTAGTF